MQSIKSYTDINQSKKLAKILPHESADIYYGLSEDESTYIINFGKPQGFFDKTQVAWSLAVLYSILPNNKKESTTLSRGGWKIDPIEYLDNWWCEYEDDSHTKDFTVSAGNPVDACYEMILKLHERKML